MENQTSTRNSEVTETKILKVAKEIHDWAHDHMHAYHERGGGLNKGECWPTLCMSNCGDVADELAELFTAEGWLVVEGTYIGPGTRSRGSEHAWCLTQDGSIVDATLDQYGNDNPVALIPPGDERQNWYRSAT